MIFVELIHNQNITAKLFVFSLFMHKDLSFFAQCGIIFDLTWLFSRKSNKQHFATNVDQIFSHCIVDYQYRELETSCQKIKVVTLVNDNARTTTSIWKKEVWKIFKIINPLKLTWAEI